MLVAVAVAALAARVVPSEARLPAFASLVAAAKAVIGIVGSNVPGLGDGAYAESWPLAALVAASAAYAAWPS